MRKQEGKVSIVLIGAPEVDPQAKNTLIGIHDDGDDDSEVVNKIAAT